MAVSAGRPGVLDVAVEQRCGRRDPVRRCSARNGGEHRGRAWTARVSSNVRAVAAAVTSTQVMNPAVRLWVVPSSGPKVAMPIAPPIWREVLNAADAAPWRAGSTAAMAWEVMAGTSSPEKNPTGTSASISGHSEDALAAHATANSVTVRTAWLMPMSAGRPRRRVSGEARRLPTEIRPVRGRNSSPATRADRPRPC